MFFTFPEDARWNAERRAVEIGEDGMVVGVDRAGALKTPEPIRRDGSVANRILAREHVVVPRPDRGSE
jgi:hypothetical protein